MSQSKELVDVENPRKEENQSKDKIEFDLEEEMGFFDIVENTNLPSVMLANIFLYLDRKDRMNCKVVCKHWLSVLMTDVYFKKDRHLYLNHCVLKENCAPVSLFAEAPYGYNMITIGSDVVFAMENDECWKYFGDYITYLDLAPKSPIMTAKYVKMLTWMPFVKTLRVHNDGPIYAGLFGRSMEVLAEQDVKLNLEELQIECVNCNPIKNEYFDVLPKIIDISPKLTKINIERIVEPLVPELQSVMEEFPHIKVNISLETHSDKCSWLNDRGPLNLDGVQLVNLDFSYEKCKPETLKLYLEKCPTIKGLSLACKTWPTEPIEDKVVKFSLHMPTVVDYSSIESFPKLKDLAFTEICKCMEMHQPICHLGVSKLKIAAARRFKCKACLKAMMLSFPKTDDLTIEYERIDKEILSLVLEILPSYEHLQTFVMTESNLNSTTLKTALESLPELEPLSIMDLKIEVEEITDEVARLLCQKFIHVKYLSMLVTNMEKGVASTIRTILCELPALKHVQFDFKTCDVALELVAIQEAFIECGQNLKTIALPFITLATETSKQIFLKMPQLHLVKLKQMIVTRVDKDEVHVKMCQNKPKSRKCHVSPPRQEEPSFSQRHNHRDFIEKTRHHRYLRRHLQCYNTGPSVNADEINKENRRYLLLLRRHGRYRMMRRELEQESLD